MLLARIVVTSLVLFAVYGYVIHLVIKVSGNESASPTVLTVAAILSSATATAYFTFALRATQIVEDDDSDSIDYDKLSPEEAAARYRKYRDRVSLTKYVLCYAFLFIGATAAASYVEYLLVSRYFPSGKTGQSVDVLIDYLKTILLLTFSAALAFGLFLRYAWSPHRDSRCTLRRALFLGWVAPVSVGMAQLAGLGTDGSQILGSATAAGLNIFVLDIPALPKVSVIEYWGVHRTLITPLVSVSSALLAFLLCQLALKVGRTGGVQPE
ncbi:MAG: hypothetical protein AAFX05_09445 [Planctomycetota bacterium]